MNFSITPDAINDFLSFVSKAGIPVLLFLFLIYLILAPDKAHQLRALLFAPCFRFLRVGAKQYIASKIAYTTSTFFKSNLSEIIPGISDLKIRIKWVTSSNDPIFKQDGTVIIRLRETNDQSRNILSATQQALPLVVAPTIRKNIEEYLGGAIDLAFLRKLSEELGPSGRVTYQNYFLAEEIKKIPRIRELYSDLIELDQQGIFTTIFIDQLHTLGNLLYEAGELRDVTEDVRSFLEYLLTLARREIGESVDLYYNSKYFNIGIILLAKTATAEARGISPYLHWTGVYLDRGCDTVYVFGFAVASKIFGRLLKVLRGNERLWFERTTLVGTVSGGITSKVKVAKFARNVIFGRGQFEEIVKSNNVKIGDTLEGVVVDASNEIATVNVLGIDGIIRRRQCAWSAILDTRDVLNIGDRIPFIVRKIDIDRNILELTRRFSEDDPWRVGVIPKEGDIVEVTLVGLEHSRYYCNFDDKLEIFLPVSEITWFGEYPRNRKLVGSRQRIRITTVEKERRRVFGSIRRVDEDPWPSIVKSLTIGVKFQGRVVDISKFNVWVDIGSDIKGSLLGGSFERAGFEYSNYAESLVIGQVLDVVVVEIFPDHRVIRLELARNLEDGN